MFAPAGFYSDTPGQSTCVKCPDGLTTLVVVHAARSSLRVRFCTVLAVLRRALRVPISAYHHRKALASLLAARVPEFTPARNASCRTLCLLVFTGMYCNGTGPARCPDNTYTPPDGAPTRDDCRECPVGSEESPTRPGECSLCPDQTCNTRPGAPCAFAIHLMCCMID